MKNGAPIADVIIPTGSSAGAIIILDTKSEDMIKIAPKRAEPGIKYLCLGPIKSLTK